MMFEKTKPLDWLHSLLLDSNPNVIVEASQDGLLGEIIPEWNRLTGSWNIQHSTHHYPLDEHTLKVLEVTRSSPYFQSLNPYQQWITALAALLHDIDKNMGPARLQGKISVDKLHPIKSAELAKSILKRLGLADKTIQQIYTLIHHHQIIGRLFIFYPQGAPEEVVRKIALKVRSRPLLACLLALSQGDISGVQKDNAFFTSTVSAKMAHYAQIIAGEIDCFHTRVSFPRQHCRLYPAPYLQGPGFVWPFETLEQAQYQLDHWPWGGAITLPYYANMQACNAPYKAHIGFTPGNLAYWGPTHASDFLLGFCNMDRFYDVLKQPAQQASNLVSIHAYDTLQFEQVGLPDNLQLAQAEETETYMGLGTRPLFYGLYNHNNEALAGVS